LGRELNAGSNVIVAGTSIFSAPSAVEAINAMRGALDAALAKARIVQGNSQDHLHVEQDGHVHVKETSAARS